MYIYYVCIYILFRKIHCLEHKHCFLIKALSFDNMLLLLLVTATVTLFFLSRQTVAMVTLVLPEAEAVVLVAESPCTTREGSLMVSLRPLAGRAT